MFREQLRKTLHDFGTLAIPHYHQVQCGGQYIEKMSEGAVEQLYLAVGYKRDPHLLEQMIVARILGC
jgi:hypothetical protein